MKRIPGAFHLLMVTYDHPPLSCGVVSTVGDSGYPLAVDTNASALRFVQGGKLEVAFGCNSEVAKREQSLLYDFSFMA